MSRSKELPALEKHFTCKQIREQFLPLSIETIRRIFKDLPDVVKLGHAGRKNKGKYITLLIPESALRRKLAEMEKVSR
jgi:hypothetical protein